MDIITEYYKITGDFLESQVKRIEKKIPTTKDRYADYLNLLTTLIGEKIPKNIARDLIIKAGGNFHGVNAAYQIINNDYNFTVINNK